MAYPRLEGLLSGRDQDVRDPLAVEQASMHVRGKVPLVWVSLRCGRGFLNLTHQSLQPTVEGTNIPAATPDLNWSYDGSCMRPALLGRCVGIGP